MGCRYEWAHDSHVMMDIYLEAPWTWEEFEAMFREVFEVIGALETPCATIINVAKIGNLPRGNVIRNLQRSEALMPDNVFASAIVGAPYIVRVFMDILMRSRSRARQIALFTDTMQEAYPKIQERYAEIMAVSGTG